jgi:hypothetical protein
MSVSHYDFRKPLKEYKGFSQAKMKFKSKTTLERIF